MEVIVFVLLVATAAVGLGLMFTALTRRPDRRSLRMALAGIAIGVAAPALVTFGVMMLG